MTTTVTDLVWTVWIPDGHSWRVLSQFATWREAQQVAKAIWADDEKAVVGKAGDDVDVAIRAGRYPHAGRA